MSDAKLQAAKELIQEKNYEAARAVLKSIPENPTAIKWLAKLDQIAPAPKTTPNRAEAKKRGTPWGFIIAVAVVLIVVGIIVAELDAANRSYEASLRSANQYVCSQMYEQYSTQWQNCVNDMK